MKKLIIYLVIPFFALALSNCKKDCNGSFTIEGTLWNGTKNQPHTNTKIEITAGGKSSLYTGALNAKDLGTVYTNNLGKFTFTYNCIDEDDWDIVLKPGTVQATPFLKVPINQNYSQFYNIPDSVSLELVLSRRNGLNPNDTLYILFGQNLKNTFSFTSSTIKEGQFAKYRFDYTYLWGINFSIPLTYSIGYESFMAKLKQPWTNDKNLSQLEPSINSLIIYY